MTSAPRTVAGEEAGRRGWMAGWTPIFLAALALGLAFQGSRGLWEPDEGFYSNVALTMTRTHEWLIPQLNGEPFLDKPPLLYWAMAAGVEVLGESEWALRAAHALAFALTALFVGWIAREWWGERVGRVSAAVYATALGPFLAANIATPDTLLALTVAAAYLCCAKLRAADAAGARWGWAALLGLALGAGALTKGPAVLVFAPPLAFAALYDRIRERRSLVPYVSSAVLFVALALPWYAFVARRLPGAGAYFLENQLYGRLFSSELERNPGWLAGFGVYLPTLALGILPAGLVWLRRMRALTGVRQIFRWRGASLFSPDGVLAWWCLFPLAVLLAARSRLPLYVLPLFAPLAILTGRELAQWIPAKSGSLRRRLFAAAAWIGILVACKAALAYWPYARDTRRLATELRQAGIAPSSHLITVDTKKNGLALYGWSDIVQTTFAPTPYEFYRPSRPIRELIEEVARVGSTPVFVASRTTTDRLPGLLAGANLRYREVKLEVPYAVYVVEGREPPAR